MDRFLSRFPTTKEKLLEELGGMRGRMVLKDLLAREWIKKDGSQLVLTLVGRAALDRYLGAK